MNIYFCGIGGIGMSALAQYFLSEGHSVSGSEIAEAEVLPLLRSKNINIFTEQISGNVSENIDLFIYTKAILPQNPERIAAKALGIKSLSYFEALGEVSAKIPTIAIAGTHGKTTTSGLFGAGALGQSSKGTFIVGALLKEFQNSNFFSEGKDFLAVEACEYDENFLSLSPQVVAITSLEWDHADVFPTEDSYFLAFEKLCAKAQTVIFHEDEKNIHRILKNFIGTKIAVPKGESFTLNLLGEFNQRNARIAVVIADELGLLNKKFVQRMEAFSGASRRQEFLGIVNGVHIYDDYAHHPTELNALFAGIRETFPDKKMGVVYEFHQFSRTKQFLSEFLEVLQVPDRVGFFPIYGARESQADFGVSLEKDFLPAVSGSKMVEDLSSVKSFLSAFAAGDIVLFVGAGNVSAFARKTVKELSVFHKKIA